MRKSMPAALMACLLAVGTGTAARATTEPVPRTGPIFNSPVSGAARQDAISARIGKMITGTPKGGRIAIAMYHFSSLDTASQLIKAAKRKVSVQVVLDDESRTYAAYKRLRRGLGGNTKKASWVTVCGKESGCIGPEFNHNKFFLFSTTRGTRNMVVQTSANATDGARDTQWNDALVLQDPAVYAGYLAYFRDLVAQHHTADYHRTVQAGKYRLDFFPWAKGDPISQALDQVSCEGGTRLRLSLGHFTWGPIARRLWKLDSAGCRVQVVFDIVGPVAIDALTQKGGKSGNPETRYLTEGGRTTYAHSKYLLIDGLYQGRPQKVVFTGSNNYTTVGFHGHDEAMITVADPQLETEYAANFDAVFDHGHAVKPTDPHSLPKAVLEPEDPDEADHSGE
ncbi:phospholipase D-like domain-containing protein [Actinomadura sp. DC4]|uniref:phospholipase D-like domain-containing protein n=1 Tax=Actinomadura sp. DC4 TaxID=3055069 RepID=UPI0025B0C2D8|nr:phospholipase D-like domain-containing protein [Actinomadura sp. DC4]MDN3357166.1 phospholipase D-like domain-containing protein [Actinomadura sp. DC4]